MNVINTKKAKTPAPKTQGEFNFFTVGEIQAIYKAADRDTAQIKCSQDTEKQFRACFDPMTIQYKESMFALFLNKANKVLAWARISEGGQSGTVCDPKIILHHALLSNAAAIIIAHNHPSGNLKPSGADMEMTRKIGQACKFMDITLLDHLILTDTAYYSFADEGEPCIR